MVEKISAMIMTHNNERTIEQCIQSIKTLAEELIIVDDFSTDRTIEIAESIFPEVKIFKRNLNNDFASQRNFALTKPAYDWVLFIDSDEVVTPALHKEIQEVLSDPKYEAYISRRDNQVMDAFFKNTSGRPILMKRHLKFRNRLHESIYGIKFGYLKSPLLHYSWKDVNDWITDMRNYSYMTANKWIKEDKPYGKLHIFLIGTCMPPVWLVKLFVLEQRWKGGLPALLYCIGWACQWTFTALQYYEMKYLRVGRKSS